MTEPRADTSANGDPATPPKIVQPITLLMPKPPRTWPTKLLAKRTMRSAIPPYSISSPAKTKNGMARKEKTCMPPTIFWNTMATGKPAAMMVATEDSPMAKATGTPRIKRSEKLSPRTVSSILLFPNGLDHFALQERNNVFYRKKQDQSAGNDHRHIVNPIGHGQHGFFF